jgi:hypothetical protein
MATFSEHSRFSPDDILDYEAMQSDFAAFDRAAEERYRDAEINYGLEPAGLLVEPIPPRCQCGLCVGLPELPAAIPAQSETRVRPQVLVAERWDGSEWIEVKLTWNGSLYAEVA